MTLAIRIAIVFGIVAAITFICFRAIPVNATTVGFAYLVAILFIATKAGRTEAIVASVAAVACFNYYFLPPIGTFTIADPQNWVALFAFLATAITASHFSTQAKQRTLEAMDRQREMEKLYALSRSILLIEPTHSVPKQLAMQIAQGFGASAVALFDRDSGEFYRAGPEDFQDSKDQLRQAAMEGTFFRDEVSHTLVTSVRLGAQPIGSLGIHGVDLSDSALQGLSNLVAIGLERIRAQKAASKAEVARQSDELKSTLLDALAHEFKTPLTSIKAASTSLLSSHGLKPDQERELITIVDEEADRLSVLVTEAIQMARIEAGRVLLRRENHSVRELVESVLVNLKPMTAERIIETDLASGLTAVSVDRELIEVVLRQLLDNAIKYSPPQSPVVVAAEPSNSRVIISVADRGPGIPESEQTRIFEKFHRAEASRHQIPGAGLGLAIAREIVHAHGGEIWVDSTPGQGAVFRFSLPAAKGVKPS
ncbi:MAG TPA: ATP-binding protein [Bryobacteraceae bacterium]|nr:ATP-binding protein [Bryobacteraceae bacterium]